MEVNPKSALGDGWMVTLEIGPYPMVDDSCTTWRNTYSENGTPQGVKDYRLCRGRGAEDLFIDEGGGVTIAAQWIGDALVSPFKYKGVFLSSTMRMRGDVLEEEILTVDDKPAVDGVVVSTPAISIHLIKMKRTPVEV